ncbi:MAG: hypothetical protein IJX63_03755, partial [Lachnospiraceae bacterium]|nr:hypothetical protein [Lachnospiraceae bacterium]
MGRVVPRVREDVYNIRCGDEVKVGGMLYVALEDFDKGSGQVLVCCYDDFKVGGFDYKNPYYITADSIFERLQITPEMETKAYYEERLKYFRETVEELPPPCECEKLNEWLKFSRGTYNKEDFVKRMQKEYPEDVTEDFEQITDYLWDVVKVYLGKVCSAYAAIHRERQISETEGSQRDKELVICICRAAFPWISEENVL